MAPAAPCPPLPSTSSLPTLSTHVHSLLTTQVSGLVLLLLDSLNFFRWSWLWLFSNVWTSECQALDITNGCSFTPRLCKHSHTGNASAFRKCSSPDYEKGKARYWGLEWGMTGYGCSTTLYACVTPYACATSYACAALYTCELLLCTGHGPLFSQHPCVQA